MFYFFLDYVIADPSHKFNEKPAMKEIVDDAIAFPSNSKKVNRSYQFKNRRKLEEVNAALNNRKSLLLLNTLILVQ